MIANVLSIAGSDPSGGAGIQADLKAFAARGVYGMAAMTALTAQNTQGVSAVHAVPPDFVAEQIRMIFADVRVDAVKIGMIANADIARAVCLALAPHPGIRVVLDPVMIAKSGAALLQPEAVAAVVGGLLPVATVLTPNLPEAGVLLGEPPASDRRSMEEHARRLLRLGPSAVLLKGGHLDAKDSPDLLATAEGVTWFEGARHATLNTHGTGCTLSSAIAAELAKGHSLVEAVGAAKHYVAEAVVHSGELGVGKGHGPLHHFWQLWPRD